MNSDLMRTSADMIFTDAVQDLAARDDKSVDAVRTEFIESGAYAALYDFETGLWQTGPDYFIGFHESRQANRPGDRR